MAKISSLSAIADPDATSKETRMTVKIPQMQAALEQGFTKEKTLAGAANQLRQIPNILHQLHATGVETLPIKMFDLDKAFNESDRPLSTADRIRLKMQLSAAGLLLV